MAATLFWANSVRVVATTNVTKSNPGASFDGVNLTNAGVDRLLLIGQANPAENGIWIWNGSNSLLTRPAGAGDYSGTNPGVGMTVLVTEGNVYAHTAWRITAPTVATGLITVDATAVTFGRHEQVVNVQQFLARGDGADNKSVTDGNATNGSTTLTSATAGFTGSDVGRVVIVKSGATILSTTIAAFTNSTTITMAAAWTGTTTTTATVEWGTNDYSAIKSAIAAAGGGVVYFPPGTYMVAPPVTTSPANQQEPAITITANNTTLQGVPGASIIKALGGTSLATSEAISFPWVIYASGLSNVKILDLIVDVNQSARASDLNTPPIGPYPSGTNPIPAGGINLFNCTDCLLQGVTVKNTIGLSSTTAVGVQIGGGTRIRLVGCTATACGIGGRISDGFYASGSRIVLEGCIAESCLDTGFVFEQTDKSGGTNLRAVDCGAGAAITNFGPADHADNFLVGLVVGKTTGATSVGVSLGMTSPNLWTGTGNLLNTTLSNIQIDNGGANFAAISVYPLSAWDVRTITGATNATPIRITSAAHAFKDADIVFIAGVSGNTNANGRRKVAYVDADHFDLKDPDTGANISGNGTYTSGGTAQRGALVTGATNATPVVVSTNYVNGHGLVAGDVVSIFQVGGNTATNGRFKVASPVTTNSFAITYLDGTNVVGNGAWTSGGVIQKGGRTIGLRMSNVNVSAAGTQGVLVENADHVTITGGSVTSQASAIQLQTNVTDVKIEGIAVYPQSSTGYGITWLTGCDKITIGGCTVFGNPAVSGGTPWGMYGFGASTNVRVRADNAFHNCAKEVGSDSSTNPPRSANDLVFRSAAPADSLLGYWPLGAMILNTNPSSPGSGPFGWQVTTAGLSGGGGAAVFTPMDFVDKANAQTAAGAKTWSNDARFNGFVGINQGPPTKAKVQITAAANDAAIALQTASGTAALIFDTTGNYGWLDYNANSGEGVRFSALGPLRFGQNNNATYPNTWTEALRLTTSAADFFTTVKTDVISPHTANAGVQFGAAKFTPLNDLGTVSGNFTFDCSLSNHHKVTYSANAAVTLSNLKAGAEYVFHFIHDSTANSYTLTWPGVIKVVGGGGPGQPTQTASAHDMMVGWSDGTNLYMTAFAKNFS